MSEPRGGNEALWTFVAGAVVGVILFAVLVLFTPGSYMERARKAKDACEANLPRNQKCVITAVPELDTGRAK